MTDIRLDTNFVDYAILAAYFIGVALVGAGLGARAANLIWTQIEGDPHPFVVVLFSVAGALLATWLQRYVIILATAFGGAWTVLVGGLALMGDRIVRVLSDPQAGEIAVLALCVAGWIGLSFGAQALVSRFDGPPSEGHPS